MNFSQIKSNISSKKGFTLIELLIVIAVLGVLAAVVLVAINPVEQLARGRDAGRKNTVGQLNSAAQAYYTVRQGYPTASATWITDLVNAGEIRSVPAAVPYSLLGACTTNAQNSFCYADDGATPPQDSIIFVRMESSSENDKCPAATPDAFFLWSSGDGRTGVVCMATGTQPAAMSGYTYF